MPVHRQKTWLVMYRLVSLTSIVQIDESLTLCASGAVMMGCLETFCTLIQAEVCS